MAALQLQRDEDQKCLVKTGAELIAERQARAAAEQRARNAEAAQKELEKQLFEQEQRQQKLQAQWSNLNSLYNKLHATRTSRAANR